MLKYFNSKHTPVAQVLYNGFIAAAIVCLLITIISCIAGGMPIWQIPADVASIVVLLICLYIANAKDKLELSATIVCLVLPLLVFPAMFFTGGGIKSGMPIWMLFGFILAMMYISGRKCTLIMLIELVADTACVVIQYFKPQWVITIPTEAGYYLDVWLSFIFVIGCLALIVRIQMSSVSQKNTYLERMNEQAVTKMGKAEAANEAKTAFLTHMSHEIRTPINAMLGMDEMIRRECTDEKILEYAKHIDVSGHVLLSLVDDILDYTRLEDGNMELDVSNYHLSSLLHDSLIMIWDKAYDKHLEISLDIDKDLPMELYGDEFRVRQMILNLLTNAVKYTKVGKVSFKVWAEDRTSDSINMMVRVKDTGIGISEKDQANLFESFTRFQVKDNQNIAGTGLGLCMVKQMADLMGASITVSSKVGVGTEFVLRIPQKVVDWEPLGDFEAEYQKEMSPSVEESYEFYAPEGHILVVDDVSLNLTVVRNLLKDTRVKVDTAESGRDCLKCVENTKYDIIYMDHMMPEMDGVETLMEMEKLASNQNRQTPVIMLTANAIAGMKEQYLSQGFADYLSKPVTGKELTDSLRQYLPKDKIVKKEDLPQPKTTKKENDKEVKELTTDSLKERFPFIDLDSALEYTGGSEELYLSLYEDNKFYEWYNLLQQYFEEKDWPNYRVYAHSTKSTMKTLGFTEFSEFARKMEEAAAEEDSSLIEAEHAVFMIEFLDIVDGINELMGN